MKLAYWSEELGKMTGVRISPKAMEALKQNESSVVVNGQRYEIEEPSRQRRRAIQRERLKAFNRHKKLKIK